MKAGADTLDYAYDVSKGFGQGGPVGALGAALKKGLEGWVVILYGTNPTGAVELNADYQAKVKNLIVSTAQKAPEIIVSRYIKEAITKPAKDGFNDFFLKFYEEIYGNVPSYLDQREQKAWVAYFEAQALSDAYLALWQQASDNYWASYDAFQGLETRKVELLAARNRQRPGTPLPLSS